jgi:hypothetical protein
MYLTAAESRQVELIAQHRFTVIRQFRHKFTLEQNYSVEAQLCFDRLPATSTSILGVFRSVLGHPGTQVEVAASADIYDVPDLTMPISCSR